MSDSQVLAWRATPLSSNTQIRVLDVFEVDSNRASGPFNETTINILEIEKSKDEKTAQAFLYVQEKLQDWHRTGRKSHALVKLVLPTEHGYAVQSDFVQRRLVDCPNVSEVRSFIEPGAEIHPIPKQDRDAQDVEKIAHGAIAGILVISPHDTPLLNCSRLLDIELQKRLSFPWLSRMPVPRKRLVLIGGRRLLALEGYTTAAASLNIAIVVLDEASHWLADPQWAHLREDFVPFDMTADETLPRRIANTLGNYPQKIDGIMTIEEHLLTLVSEAAALMGLPTSPPDSVGMAQNKYRTRQLDKSVYCSHVRTASELDDLIKRDREKLNYPLIIKPSRGWASEGVWKICNESHLRDAAARLWKDSFAAWHGHEIVIETYVDGPEVDVNMVLHDGELLFFEVNDDFPSPGDKDDSSRFANFVEDSNMIPSQLPQAEIEMLKRSLHQYLLKANFRSGVFHIEARVRNSSCCFSDTEGFLDLHPKRVEVQESNAAPDAFLLEINPRAPGMQEINATERAYGVSYYSLSLLNALSEAGRMRALSVPFAGGAQYHLQILFISAEKGGVYKSGDVCKALFNRCPELEAYVAESASFLQDGQVMPDPSTGSMTWIAFFLIYSRISRLDALQAGQRVREGVKSYMEERQT